MATQQVDIRILGLDKILEAIRGGQTKLELITDEAEPGPLDDIKWLIEHDVMFTIGRNGATGFPMVKLIPMGGLKALTFEGPLDRVFKRVRRDIEKQIGGSTPRG